MENKRKRNLPKTLFILSILIYPAILFLILYVYVNLNSFALAFQNIDLANNKTFAGWDNFKDVFRTLGSDTDPALSMAIVNSLKMYALNLVICMPLYIIFSYYLFKKHFGSKVFRVIVMIPAIVSTFIICMVFVKFIEGPFLELLRAMGVENPPAFLKDEKYAFGTTIFYMIWVSFSTSLIVYPNAMNSIDPGIIESAHIDGANAFRELWHIILPLIYPTISTFLITGVAGIFTNQGPLISFYMYSAPNSVQNLGYYITVEVLRDPVTGVLKYPFLSAIGLLVTAVSVPLTFAVRRVLSKCGPVDI